MPLKCRRSGHLSADSRLALEEASLQENKRSSTTGCSSMQASGTSGFAEAPGAVRQGVDGGPEVEGY